MSRAWCRNHGQVKKYHLQNDDWVQTGLAACGEDIRYPGLVIDAPYRPTDDGFPECKRCSSKYTDEGNIDWSRALEEAKDALYGIENLGGRFILIGILRGTRKLCRWSDDDAQEAQRALAAAVCKFPKQARG